jgi:hypothetical protein
VQHSQCRKWRVELILEEIFVEVEIERKTAMNQPPQRPSERAT